MKPEEFVKKYTTNSNFRQKVFYVNIRDDIYSIIDMHMKGKNIIDTPEEKYRGAMFDVCMQVLNMQLQTIIKNNMDIAQIKEIRAAINMHRTK